MPYQEPDYLPWDGRRVPMTFIAGYLGAGKTTLINRLLEIADRPLAVLVNDVGSVNVDAALIRSRSGDAIELTDGCVCCSLSDGFGAALDMLRARPNPPEHVIVELSGLAEPSRMLPWSRSAGFKLDGMVTLVDADRLAGTDDDGAGDVVDASVTAQVGDADLVVLTKLDLVDPEDVERATSYVESLAPGIPVIVGPPDTTAELLNLGGRDPDGTASLPTPTLFDRHTTSTIPLPKPATPEAIDAILDRLPPEVVRAKGIAATADGGRLLIQLVGRRRSVTELPQPEVEPPTDLVVISLDRHTTATA